MLNKYNLYILLHNCMSKKVVQLLIYKDENKVKNDFLIDLGLLCKEHLTIFNPLNFKKQFIKQNLKKKI